MSIRECKHCNTKFDISNKPSGWMANHSRWCDKNPKRQEYVDKLKNNGGISNVELMNAARKKSGRTNQHTAGTFKGHKEETIQKWKLASTGKKHTEETKRIIQKKALLSKHRRLKKGTVEYKGILLDSSWELALAKRLDDLNVKWVRPDPIQWIDKDGVKHNYFPDFYLPDYNKYLDPKNPHAVKVQEKKLKMLFQQHSNICIISSLEECMNFNC